MDYNFNEVENINLYGTKIKVSSREQLSETINSLKMKKRTDLEKYFEKFYEKGYTSERIIINASNSKLLKKYIVRRKITLIQENLFLTHLKLQMLFSVLLLMKKVR